MEYCNFEYTDKGFLQRVECRGIEGLLSEVWDFTYEDDRLVSAFEQLPNFRAIADYEYDKQGKPVSVVSTTGEIFNWSGSYFYFCR